jgi:hypothetical protein
VVICGQMPASDALVPRVVLKGGGRTGCCRSEQDFCAPAPVPHARSPVASADEFQPSRLSAAGAGADRRALCPRQVRSMPGVPRVELCAPDVLRHPPAPHATLKTRLLRSASPAVLLVNIASDTCVYRHFATGPS